MGNAYTASLTAQSAVCPTVPDMPSADTCYSSGLTTEQLARGVQAVLCRAEELGVEVGDLAVQFEQEGTPSYAHLLALFARLNAAGYWTLEEGSLVILGQGEPPSWLFLRRVASAPDYALLMIHGIGHLAGKPGGRSG